MLINRLFSRKAVIKSIHKDVNLTGIFLNKNIMSKEKSFLDNRMKEDRMGKPFAEKKKKAQQDMLATPVCQA
jgi:hypothetical protein